MPGVQIERIFQEEGMPFNPQQYRNNTLSLQTTSFAEATVLAFLDVLVGGGDQDPGSQPSHLSPSRKALLQSKIYGGRGGNQGRSLGRS